MHDGISEIVKNHQGNIETEKQYKYTGRSRGKCLANDKIAVKTKFTGYTAIKSGDEDALKLATYNEVTISVGIDASSNKFQLYDHGGHPMRTARG